MLIYTIYIIVLTCLDRVIIMLMSLSMLATYIMDLCLLIHRLNLHRIVHHKLICWWVTVITKLIWELRLILVNHYILHQIQLEWRLHRICFHHHLLRLACFIQFHLFIAKLKKVQQTHLLLASTYPTSTKITPSSLPTTLDGGGPQGARGLPHGGRWALLLVWRDKLSSKKMQHRSSSAKLR
jgi:hypothetical protein